MGDGPRVLRPDRAQFYWDMIDLESQIAADHLVRVVWAFVEGLDLSALYDAIRARDEVAGRPTPDPKVLLAVWLYATAEGIGSARAVERLCRTHAAYRWLVGGVPVNYHGLSDFRSGHGELLDRVLTESVASLAASGLLSLDEVAVDGTKVQANAGRGSFRGSEALGRFEASARERVSRLKAEVDADPGASERRRRASAERAAKDVVARAEAAWRARMATVEGRMIYARRRMIEIVNGDLKNHGLRRFFLRGLAKVACEARLHAIAHNLRRACSLGFTWA